MDERQGDSSDTGLPFAQGRSFASLDDYLAHLERRGATGVPFYRRTSQGDYELVSGRGRRGPPARYSRAALMQRFGFVE